MGSNLEKYGIFWKNGRFSRRIWPDWGNTAWADMAGLGSIGLTQRSTTSVNLCMASLFSLQIATSNGGPATALVSLGEKWSFRCISLNIHRMYKQ